MRIEPYLARQTERHPEKTALVVGAARISYGELDRISGSLAAGLMLHGVKPGDRVLLLLDNGWEAAASFLAVWRIGAVACPLHPSLKAEKLGHIIGHTGAAAIIAPLRAAHLIETAKIAAGSSLLPILVHGDTPPTDGALSFETLVSGNWQAPQAHPGSDEDLALIIHTSGSTGRAKGVMLTHTNLDAACSAIVGYLGNTEDDVVLSVLPLSFGYGITQMVTMLMVGGTLVLERSFAFPRAILNRLAEVEATGLPVVPAMATMIAGMQDLAPGFLPRLRYLTNAAAAMPPSTTAALRRLLPATNIHLMYGQTECIRTACLAPGEVDRRPLSVGKAIPCTRVEIVGDDGLAVAPGEVGELIVEGPHVMVGYWNDPAATALALDVRDRRRRLRTGDLFRSDAEGFLYFVARRDDIIKTRGEKVSPQEVENVLYSLPGVLEAAVEGVADPLFGQVVKAHVVMAPDVLLTERDVVRHCAQYLEDFMIPKLVEFHEALPKTTTGKIRLSLTHPSLDDKGNVA
ncbi:class I adenylate-forming enzyme family protein [Rhizobium sp. SAFR-030]|uniref:class I adenylate-forming enzyme family protein n=1 Tax=Rhizobium sp. SAFR-030 TaxID=3387277 RepID=UPI003F80AA7F